MTSSEVLPAGISWAVTFWSGFALFQSATIALPQAISSGLFDSQTLIGPVALARRWSPYLPTARGGHAQGQHGGGRGQDLRSHRCSISRGSQGVARWVTGLDTGGGCRSSRGRRAARAAGRPGAAPCAWISASSWVAAARPQATTSVATVVSERLQVGGDLHVVEPGDRELAGDRDAAGDREGQPGHRHQVVGVDDRRRWLGEVEQRVGGRGARTRPEKSASTQRSAGSPAACSASSQAARRERPCTIVTRAGDVRDAGVPEGDEVLDGGPDAGGVVDPERGGRVVLEGRPDHHAGQPELGEQRRARVVDAEVGDEHAVDATLLGEPRGRWRRRRARRPSAAARARARTARSRGRR